MRSAKLKARGEYALLAEAVVGLAIAALWLTIVPFRHIVGFTSTPVRPEPSENERAHIIAAVRWSVVACSRRVPWRAKCLEQGLVAMWMLRRRGIAAMLHYGLARDAKLGLIAHVWVSAGDEDVIGCETQSAFSEVARFPAQI